MGRGGRRSYRVWCPQPGLGLSAPWWDAAAGEQDAPGGHAVGGTLVCRDRCRLIAAEVDRSGQVGGELVELEAGGGRIGRGRALLQLLQGEAPLHGVLLEELDDPVPFAVGGSQRLAASNRHPSCLLSGAQRATTRRQARAANATAPTVQATSTTRAKGDSAL